MIFCLLPMPRPFFSFSLSLSPLRSPFFRKKSRAIARLCPIDSPRAIQFHYETRTASLMIYRSISFNLGALYRELGHLLQFRTCQPVGKLSARNFKSLASLYPSHSLAQSCSCRVETRLVSRISLLSRGDRDGRTGECAGNLRAAQKPTYPTKMFSFQLRAACSSAEQSSITELLRFPNLPLVLSSSVVPR